MASAKKLVEALGKLKQPVTLDQLTAAMMQNCITKDELPISIPESVREAIQLGWIQKTTSGFYVIGRDEEKNTEKKPNVAKAIDALTPPWRMTSVSVTNWRKYARNVVIKSKKRRTQKTVTPKIIADVRLDDEGACASSRGTSAIDKTYAELVMEAMFSDARFGDEGADVSSQGTSATDKTYAELVMEAMFLDARLDDEGMCAPSQGTSAIDMTYAEIVMDGMFMGPKKTSKVKAQGGQEARPKLPKKQCIKKPRGRKAVKPVMVMDAHQGTSTNEMTYGELVMEAMFCKKLPAENAVFRGPEETAKGEQEVLPKSQKKQTIRKKPRGKKAVEPLMIMDAHLGDEGACAKSEGTTSDDISYTDLVMEGILWKKLRRENAIDLHGGGVSISPQGTAPVDVSIESTCKSSPGIIPVDVMVAVKAVDAQKPQAQKEVKPLIVMDDADLVDKDTSISAQNTGSVDVKIANPCDFLPATIPVDVPVTQPMDEESKAPMGTTQVNSQYEQKSLPKTPKKQGRNDVRKNKAKKKFCAKKAVKSRKIRDANPDGLEQPKNYNFPFVNQFMRLVRAFGFMGPKENAQGTVQHNQRKTNHGKAAPKKKNVKGPQKKKR